jgi:hypothetical protein
VATLFGDVIDAHGAPAEDTTVILFPRDESKWGPRSGLVTAVLCDIEGRFTMTGLATGAYHVIARERVAYRAWDDVKFLRGLVEPAVRIELREGATEISLKVED